MTLSDLHNHLPIASLFKRDFSYSRAEGDNISTDSASRGPSAIAELFKKHFYCSLRLHALSSWFLSLSLLTSF